MRSLFVLATIAVMIGYPVFSRTRERAARSPEARTRAIVRALAGIMVGAVLALWLPAHVPETPGSPGTLVGMLVLWFVGGTLMLLSVIALGGALLARPDH